MSAFGSLVSSSSDEEEEVRPNADCSADEASSNDIVGESKTAAEDTSTKSTPQDKGGWHSTKKSKPPKSRLEKMSARDRKYCELEYKTRGTKMGGPYWDLKRVNQTFEKCSDDTRTELKKKYDENINHLLHQDKDERNEKYSELKKDDHWKDFRRNLPAYRAENACHRLLVDELMSRWQKYSALQPEAEHSMFSMRTFNGLGKSREIDEDRLPTQEWKRRLIHFQSKKCSFYEKCSDCMSSQEGLCNEAYVLGMLRSSGFQCPECGNTDFRAGGGSAMSWSDIVCSQCPTFLELKTKEDPTVASSEIFFKRFFMALLFSIDCGTNF